MTDFSWQMEEWEEAGMEMTSETLSDEINGIDELKLSNRMVKTDEEIEKLILDEDLTGEKRAIYLIKYGNIQQKSSIFQLMSSPNLSCNISDIEKFKILASLLDTLQKEKLIYQLSFAKSFTDVFSHIKSKEGGTKTADYLVKPIYKLMESGKDQQIFDAWSEVILKLIPHLTIPTIELEILPEALMNSGIAQPAHYRIWACKVLAVISELMEPKRVENSFLKKALALCQDTDYEVRAEMCRTINSIARKVGMVTTKELILEEYIELLNDEEIPVKIAAIENMILLLDTKTDSKLPIIIEPSVKKNQILPIYKNFASEKDKGFIHFFILDFQLSFYKELGHFLWTIEEELNEEDLHWFMNQYFKLAVLPELKFKEALAYNLPVISKLLRFPQDREAFKEVHLTFLGVFNVLGSDPQIDIRRKIASSFSIIVTNIGKSSFQLCKNLFLKLFEEEHREILIVLIPGINDTLKAFSQSNTWSKHDEECNDLLTIILKKYKNALTGSLKYRYSNILEFTKQFSKFPQYFDHELIVYTLVPALIQIMLMQEAITLEITTIILEVCCIYSRMINRLEYRDRIWRILKEHLIYSKNNYKTRMLFLYMCGYILDLFSQKVFKEYFMHDFLECSKDPVPNIRLKFVQMISEAKKCMNPLTDSARLQLFNDAIQKMLHSEKDRGVQPYLTDYITSYNKPDDKCVMFRYCTVWTGRWLPDKEREAEEMKISTEEEELRNKRQQLQQQQSLQVGKGSDKFLQRKTSIGNRSTLLTPSSGHSNKTAYKSSDKWRKNSTGSDLTLNSSNPTITTDNEAKKKQAAGFRSASASAVGRNVQKTSKF